MRTPPCQDSVVVHNGVWRIKGFHVVGIEIEVYFCPDHNGPELGRNVDLPKKKIFLKN